MKKPKIIWENNVVVDEILMSEKTKMVVSCSVRSGIKYLNMREWYFNRAGEWRPSLKGFCMGIEVPIKEGTETLHPVQPFIDLLLRTVDISKDLALYDEANVVYEKIKEA